MLRKNVILKDYTSFKLGGRSKYFLEVKSAEQLHDLTKLKNENELKFLILGAGTNVVISDSYFDGIVLKISIPGIEKINDNDKYSFFRVGAGVIWDDFVKYSVDNSFWGIENMSLIPGTVGAVPVQNVGAYGQDVSKVIVGVTVYDIKHKVFCYINNKDCNFSWRKSIFNTTSSGRYIICSVDFRLKKYPSPDLSRDVLKNNIDLSDFNGLSNGDNALLLEIRSLVIKLRTSGKNLPILESDFNVGTFFPAFLVPNCDFNKIFFKLLLRVGVIPAFKLFFARFKYKYGSSFKLPSTFLLNISNVNSICTNNFKLMNSNPGVVIHNGKGDSEEFLSFIEDIINLVEFRTGIRIPIEPKLVGFSIKDS